MIQSRVSPAMRFLGSPSLAWTVQSQLTRREDGAEVSSQLATAGIHSVTRAS